MLSEELDRRENEKDMYKNMSRLRESEVLLVGDKNYTNYLYTKSILSLSLLLSDYCNDGGMVTGGSNKRPKWRGRKSKNFAS